MVSPLKSQNRIPHTILDKQCVSAVTFPIKKLPEEHGKEMHSELGFVLFSKWKTAVPAK